MADPVDVPLGPSTLVRKWRLEVNTGTSGAATLSSALTTGAPITSLPVTALPATIAAGTTLTFVSGGNTQTWTVTATAVAGATSITVTSQTPNFAYPTTTTITSSAWVKVRGIKNFQPVVNTTNQDDSDYDSSGWGSQTSTKLDWQMTLTVARKVDETTTPPSYDIGQEALRAIAGTLGTSNTASLRWCEMGPQVRVEAYQGNALVTWGEAGGAMDALDDVNVTLIGQGKRFAITHPYPLS